jgi:predicted CXXCH cytochrome family protein
MIAGLLLGAMALSAQTPSATEPDTDSLAALGYAVTGGAAPGYVEDRACANCHSELYESYQEVAMARAFYRPSQEVKIEDFSNAHLYHEASLRHYEMHWRDGKMTFRRYQLAGDGQPINVFECDVDWIMGSGNHARSYLYQTPTGELYQLPIGWYSQSRTWGMSPGFDKREHLGVMRLVRRGCMFCHNAYPDVPVGSDTFSKPHTYPHDLPAGLGCQRCHGPGARHARMAFDGDVGEEQIRAAIINPARLSPQLRNDICYGCHLQPAVAVTPLRRFGHGDYSFRPGQMLAAHRVYFDPLEEGRERSERFEINHHPYRLEQSRCFIESNGKMSCLTCHDPHRKVKPAQQAAHYRAACLSCHEIEDCGDEATGPASDCVSCHLSQRRPEDVVHVVMTDHLIRRQPGGPELAAPLSESDPVLVGLDFLHPQQAPAGPEGEIYRAIAVLRAGGGADAADWLKKQLGLIEQRPAEALFELARAQLNLRQYAAAELTLSEILEGEPDNLLIRELQAAAMARNGKRKQAVQQLGELVDRAERPEASYHLGMFLLEEGATEEAIGFLKQSLQLRPHQALAWLKLSNAYAKLGKHEQAAAHARRALEIEPTFSRAYTAIILALLELDRADEARRYLKHGADVAADPESIRNTLSEEAPSILKPE